MEIRKVLERKDGIKMVIVPKNSDFQKDDYVMITKVEEPKPNKKINKKEVTK